MNAPRFSIVLVIALASLDGSETARAKSGSQVTTVRESELAWAAAPPGLPAGAQMVVLAGDPSQAAPFTLRLKFPAGYVVPPHTHPATEHVTIVRGRMGIGGGETFDEAALAWVSRGDFFSVPANAPHFGRTKSETIIEINATGPWGLTYVNAADEPSGGD